MDTDIEDRPARAAAPHAQRSMGRETRPAPSGQRVMIHLASRVTDEVMSFLGPATEAMLAQDCRQVVIALDDPGTRTQLSRFHPQVELRRVAAPKGGASAFMRLLAAMRQTLAEVPRPQAVHLHGVLPCVVGAWALRPYGRGVPVYFSPHASKLLGSLQLPGRILVGLARRLGGGHWRSAIASGEADVTRLEKLAPERVELVESPVDRRLFELPRAESSRPVIVAGGWVTRGAEPLDMFTRFAVLLGDGDNPAEFVWLGEAGGEEAVKLSTAKVRTVPLDDGAARAALLAQAWIYVAPAGGRGVPVGLAEAMAAGVPCLAADTPFNASVIHDEVDGLLYRDEDQALRHIARLLDDRGTRDRLGAAARASAARRFLDTDFRRRLVQAYRQPEESDASVRALEPAAILPPGGRAPTGS